MDGNNARSYALVTGASSGIGWHMAEWLALRDYGIIAISNQADRLEELKKKLEDAYHIHVDTFFIDLAREDAAREVFQYCIKRDYDVEVLINNAGIMAYGETIHVDYEHAQSILNLHMTTPALMCRLFGEKMAMSGSGWILNVSSISAVMPYPTISLYGPTKSFLRHFTRAFRTEMKPLGVKVTCLIPGATDTPLNEANEISYERAKKFGLVKNPAHVAEKGLNALFHNRAECIPGFFNKCVIRLVPILPYSLIGQIYRRCLLPKRMNDTKQAEQS